MIAGEAMDAVGDPLPADTLNQCLESDAVLFGSWGGSKWEGNPRMKPSNLLKLRKAMKVYANLRPFTVFPELRRFSPLKDEIAEDLDILVVRELLGGAYFGAKTVKMENGVETASDLMFYSKPEIERIGHRAFELASRRRGKLTSVDKTGVLASSDLWRKTITELAPAYPSVGLEHMLVDNCAMHLITDPNRFDVIVAENLLGTSSAMSSPPCAGFRYSDLRMPGR
jgi:3-isopropylmalate dehydrogenase